jgi:hypothetical protein
VIKKPGLSSFHKATHGNLSLVCLSKTALDEEFGDCRITFFSDGQEELLLCVEKTLIKQPLFCKFR